MYGIDQNTQSEGAGFTGIQENFELANVRYGKISAKEDKTAVGLVFEFKRGENFNLPITVFPVNEENAAQYKNKIKDKTTGEEREETREEAIKRAYDEQAVFIKHIMTKYLPEDKVIIPKVNSFEQFAKAVITLLGDSYKGVKVRLKILYNKKGMLILPKFPAFIELMSVKPSKLTLSDYDKKWTSKPTADKEGSTTTTQAAVNNPAGEEF